MCSYTFKYFYAKFQTINHEKHDENANETTNAETKTKSEDLLTPAFPDNRRRVSQVDQQCCGGFKQSGVCAVM